jgi:penicillin G amidase
MAALQNDVVSLPAQSLVRALASSSAANDPSAKLLTGWNGELKMDSSVAALYELWLQKLHGTMLKQIAPNTPSVPIYLGPDTLARLLGHPAADFFGDNPIAQRDKIVRETLTAAYAEFQSLGSGSSTLTWGRLHTVLFRHSLDQLLDLKSLLDVGPFPRPGDGTTVNATAFVPQNFDQIAGASYREIFDLSNWDHSEAVNTPGESGQPESPHYQDLAPLWRDGKYFPLAYSRGAVEQVTVDRLELLPPGH